MIVVIYIVSVVVFYVAEWIVAICLCPILWVYKGITKADIYPEHPAFLMVPMSAAVILLYLTRYVWGYLGYNPGWLFPSIIAAIHLAFGGASTANRANKAQAYGTVLGVIIYALSRVFM